MTVTLSFEVHRNEKDGHFGSQFARLTIADAVRDILTALGQWPRECSLINQKEYSDAELTSPEIPTRRAQGYFRYEDSRVHGPRMRELRIPQSCFLSSLFAI